MNIYLVISEILEVVVWEEWFSNVGHREDYCIAALVVARNHGQARWLAWKSDKDSFTGAMRDMPRFTCRTRAKDVELPVGVIKDVDNPAYEQYWSLPDGAEYPDRRDM